MHLRLCLHSKLHMSCSLDQHNYLRTESQCMFHVATFPFALSIHVILSLVTKRNRSRKNNYFSKYMFRRKFRFQCRVLFIVLTLIVNCKHLETFSIDLFFYLLIQIEVTRPVLAISSSYSELPKKKTSLYNKIAET